MSIGKFKSWTSSLALILFCAASLVANDDQIAEAIATIQNVGSNGKGHEDAVSAMNVLNSASADRIPVILAGMDDDNKLAVNWLRGAVTKLAANGNIPREKIRAYFDDKNGSQLGRLLAFELLTVNDNALAKKIIPTLIDDPSLPLRYKAVDNLIDSAKTATASEAIGMLGVALDKARNVDQVVSISKALDEKGIAIDLQKQLGFVNQWNLVGNFDNTEEAGYAKPFGPENNLSGVDLGATFEDAKDGSTSKWEPYNTTDPQGLVDLNKVVGKVKDVIVYAHATFDSDADQEADIRIGCINAHKVWVNGKLVMANEIYHNGISPDKFIGKATLKKGQNEILVKVCQNNQTEPWAQRWQFQLRVCDETGKAFTAKKKEQSFE